MPLSFAAAQWIVRALPNKLPGKSRFGRALLRPFAKFKPVRLTDPAGNIFECPSLEEPVAAGIFTFGQYERATMRAILDSLPHGGVFVDAGANIGAITIPVAALRPDAHVIAIEADPDVALLLEHNVRLNQLNNVSIIHAALGSVAAEAIPFFQAPDQKFGMGSLGQQFDMPPIYVRQVSLQNLAEQLSISEVDVLKIDVEGAELGVVRGAEAILRRSHAPTVIFEFMDWAEERIAGQQPGDAQACLLSYGYRLFRLADDGALGAELMQPLTAGGGMIVAIGTSGRAPAVVRRAVA